MQWNVRLETEQPDFGEKANPAARYESPDMHLSPREEVILRALRQAVRNGWTGWRGFVNDAVTIGLEPEGVLRDMRRARTPIEQLIYNHEFAKFLFGDEPITVNPDDPYVIEHPWKGHLQRMVVADDPLKYLSENVD
jgi:hypothetical protein